jgi:hypothetical protein
MHAFNTLVILSEVKNPRSRKVDKQLPRFFASLRMTSEGLRMTGRGNA